MKPSQLQEQVKQQLSAPECCSAATLQLLRDALGLRAKPEETKPQVSRASRQTTVASRTAVKDSGRVRAAVTSRRTIAKQDNDAFKVLEDQLPTLSAGERNALATEAVNASLRALTEAIKLSTSTAKPASSPAKQGSLKEQSHNTSGQTGKNAIEGKPCKNVSGTADQHGSVAILKVANCGRIAFKYLIRASKPSTETNGTKAKNPKWHLETAFLAFVSREYALELHDQVLADLCFLRTHLMSSLMGADADVDQKPTGSKQSATASKAEQLSTLFDFTSLTEPDVALDRLIIAHQTLSLKLVLNTGSSSIIDSILTKVSPSQENSFTARLINAVTTAEAKSDNLCKLETVAQQLLQRVAKSRRGQVDAGGKDSYALSEQTKLRMRTLALELRIRWMIDSGHQTDVTSELVKPFVSAWIQYDRDSTDEMEIKKMHELDAYKSIVACLPEQWLQAFKSSKEVAIIASRLSSEPSDFQKPSPRDGQHAAARAFNDLDCINAFRLAAINVRNQTQESTTSRSYFSILKCLDSTENFHNLNPIDVFREMWDLRKALELHFQNKKAKSVDSHNTDAISSEISSQDRSIISLLSSCLRFLARLVLLSSCRTNCDDQPAAKSQTTFHQHINTLTKGFIHTFFSFFDDLTATPVGIDEQFTEPLESTTKLIEAFDKNVENTALEQKAFLVKARLKLSDAYWLVFTRQQSNSADAKLMIPLAKSCDALRPLSIDDKRHGFLPTKLFKLSRQQQECTRRMAAEKSLVECLEVATNVSLLEEVAGFMPFSQIFSTNRDLKLIPKALKAMFELRCGNGKQNRGGSIAYDNLVLPISVRGLLLERQLEVILELLSLRHSQLMHDSWSFVAELLLELYSVDQYPVRRARVLLKLLTTKEFSIDVDVSQQAHDMVSRLSDTDSLQLGQDGELNRFVKPLRHILGLYLAVSTLPVDSSGCDLHLDALIEMFSEIRLPIAVDNIVDDTSIFWQALDSTASLLDLMGYKQLSTKALLLMWKARSLDMAMEPRQLLSNELRLFESFSALGYTSKARIYLGKAKEHEKACGPDTNNRLMLCAAELSHAQFIDETNSVSEYLKNILSLLSLDEYAQAFQKQAARPIKFDSIEAVAKAMQACSGHYFARGDSLRCLALQSQAIRLLQLSLKGARLRSQQLYGAGSSSSGSEISVEYKSDMNANHSNPVVSKLIGNLFDAYLRLVRMLQDFDLYQEALHNINQACTLAEETRLDCLQAEAQVLKSVLQRRSAAIEDCRLTLKSAETACISQQPSLNFAEYHKALGLLQGAREEWDEEASSYNRSQAAVAALRDAALFSKLSHGDPEIGDLRTSMQKMELTKPAAATKRSTQIRPATTSRSTTSAGINTKTGKDAIVPWSSDFLPLDTFESRLALHKAESLLHQDKTQEALEHLQKIANIRTCGSATDRRNALYACALLHDLFDGFAVHPVLGMLSESTLSAPALLRNTPTPAVPAPVSNKAAQTQVARRGAKNAVGTRAFKPAISPETSWHPKLLRILNSAKSTQLRAQSSCVETLRLEASAITTGAMLASFTSLESGNIDVSSRSIASYLDMPLVVSGAHERASLQAQNDESILEKFKEKADQTASTGLAFEHLPEYLDFNFSSVIPQSWDVISLNLDDQAEHLLIVKYRANEAPFLLRLPLSRHSDEDVEEDEEAMLTFQDAKSEISSVIAGSDQTVHQAQEEGAETMDKKAKSKWWSEREKLDERLKSLLLNIENVWLGGFRGIFAQQRRHIDLLKKFEQALDATFSKHLPSRRNIQKQPKSQRLAFDPSILDLFVDLTAFTEDDVDIDEALMDLLYFVVDILQFNDEVNAYDEIDFDAIVVETHDALRAYAEAARQEYNVPSATHTILVLDRRLHCFPWESLPCLENRSVSRVTSLLDVQERISALRHQSKTVDGVEVGRRNGSCFLNPSQDLHKTQSRFEKPVSMLREELDWSTVVARVPSEAEFVEALKPGSFASAKSSEVDEHQASTTQRQAPIFVYFGHGPGSQYIRPRAIERIRYQQPFHENFGADKSSAAAQTTPVVTIANSRNTYKVTCATALLFGCSSASLVQPGEYPSYGTPATYMLAGAPAVLGSLWDVTDGDCDRFAARTLENWGLLGKGDCLIEEGRRAVKKEKKQGKGKEKETSVGVSESRRLCLSEAAARARGECYLKYLNGAAMVVYGVPVFVEE